jgi:hypothetical protein
MGTLAFPGQRWVATPAPQPRQATTAAPAALSLRRAKWSLLLVAFWLVVCGFGLHYAGLTPTSSQVVRAMDGGLTPPMSAPKR